MTDCTTVALTFANRTYDREVIELIHAWDIDSVCENPGGYEESKREAIADLRDDLLRWVTVEVDIPDATIRQHLMGELPTLKASASTVTEEG